ncbi:MAG: AAA family ATPase, partial [Clostridia bacterium]
MGRAIFVTSFKGGVGKTTVSANLASALAFIGKKVLVVDGDFGMRCMDMVLGLENEIVFNIYDVLTNKCSYEEAILQYENSGFDFMPAPMLFDREEIPTTRFFELYDILRKKYDYIITDSSAEESSYYLSFAAACDDALIVSLHRSTAVRAAERTGIKLSEVGFKNLRRIVNGYDRVKSDSGELPTLFEIINRSAIKLLGAVPFSESLISDQENGVLALSSK